jgi:hypothetical protein
MDPMSGGNPNIPPLVLPWHFLRSDESYLERGWLQFSGQVSADILFPHCAWGQRAARLHRPLWAQIVKVSIASSTN